MKGSDEKVGCVYWAARRELKRDESSTRLSHGPKETAMVDIERTGERG